MRFTFVLLPHPLYIYSSSSSTSSSTVAVWLIIIAINVIASCIGRSIYFTRTPPGKRTLYLLLTLWWQWMANWVGGWKNCTEIYILNSSAVQCCAVVDAMAPARPPTSPWRALLSPSTTMLYKYIICFLRNPPPALPRKLIKFSVLLLVPLLLV